jgi:hypothetical protein
MRALALGLRVWAVLLFACGGDDSTPPSDAAVDAVADAPARECTGNADCDDGLYCNGSETCVDNVCAPGDAPAIDDGIDCTIDTCDEDADRGSNAPDNAACDDGLYCNGIESCDLVTGCVSNDAPVLDDGVDCTDDTCDEDTDAILHTPDDGACDDGAFCNGAELCDSTAGCMAGVAPDPDDSIACTVDSCDEATDAIVNAPNDGACGDGDACTDDTCTAGVGCSRPFICACMNAADCNDGNPCTNDACTGGSCVYTDNTASCDDGLYCNGADMCAGGVCTHAGDPCAGGPMCARTCTEATDSCFSPSGTACTGDGNPCTNDVCNAAGACTHPANTAPCSDGLYCNGADVCSAGACTHPGDPCASGAICNDTCNEPADSCATPAGVACTSDGNVCTDDRCNGSGTCAHPANTAPCDDGLYCNGADVCSGGACTHAGDPCAGGATCNDSCNESGDHCYAPAGAMCTDDGVVCTADVCDGAGTCAHVAAPESACGNAMDDDCDGMTDCADSDCAGDACGPGGATCMGSTCVCPGGSTESRCTNSADDDCDGAADCADSDCAGVPACACSRPRCMPGTCTSPLTCLAGTCGRGGTYGWDDVFGFTSNDSAGDITSTLAGYYVTGSFTGMVNFGGGTRTSAGSSDGVVLALALDGSYRWDVPLGGSGADAATGIVADPSGNVVVVGYLTTTGTLNDGYVRKLDWMGGTVWSRTYGTDVNPIGVAADTLGNITVVGYFQGSVDFGGGTRTAIDDTDIFVLSLTSAGTRRWDLTFDGGGTFDSAYAVATDAMGNVYVGGVFGSQIDFGGGATSVRPGGAYVASFDADGNHRWDRDFGSTQPDSVSDIAVSQLDDVVIAASFGAVVDFGGGSRSSSGWVDGAVWVLDTDGNYQWDRVYGASVDNDRVDGVAVDCVGNIVATGMFEGTVSFGGASRTSAGSSATDIFVLSLSRTGAYRWDRTLGDVNADRGLGAHITTAGRTVTVGSFQSNVNFGGGVRFGAGGTDAFILELAD